MFARILVISNTDDIKSAWLAESISELQKRRHAVTVLNPLSWADGSLNAVIKAFAPTIALWDIDSARLEPADIEALASSNSCVACVSGDSALNASAPFPLIRWPFDFFHVDGLAGEAVFGEATGISTDVSGGAPVLGVFQLLSDGRLSCVLEAIDSIKGLSCVSFDPSWGSYYESIHPFSNKRFWQRSVSIAVYFAGEDSPSAAQALYQISCGSLVLVEQGVRFDIPEIDDVVVRFDLKELASTIKAYAEDGERSHIIADSQRQALYRMPSAPDSLSYSLAAIDHVRVDKDDSLIMSQNEPCRTFTIFGWFGAHNFGDDLLLRFAVHTLSLRYPNAQFRVIGADAGVLQREFGLMACTPDQKGVVRAFLEQSDALVFCGGLLFDDPLALTAGAMEFCLDPWIEPTGQAAICLLARTLGVPSIYLGAGAGPIDNIETRRAVQLIGLSGAKFFMRDQHSCNLVSECCVDEEQVGLYADLVLGSRSYVEDSARTVSLADSLRPESPYFIVSLRDWPLNPDNFVPAIASALDRVVERTGLMPLFLPFDSDDVSIHRAVVIRMDSDFKAFLDVRPDEARLFDLIEGSSFCLAMRLHCSILHHVLGKPAVGLDYNDKIGAHFERMGQLDFLASLNIEADDLADMVERVHADSVRISDSLLETVDGAAALVDAAFDDLGRSVAFARGDGRYAPCSGKRVEYPRIASQRSVNLAVSLHDANRRIDELENEVALAEQELNLAREKAAGALSSREFEIGSSLLKIPRKVKSIFRRFINR